MEPSQAHEVREGGVDEMSIREILLQLAALAIGFIGGVMYTREIYLPVVRALKDRGRGWK